MNRKILINLPDEITHEEVSDFITRVKDEAFTKTLFKGVKFKQELEGGRVITMRVSWFKTVQVIDIGTHRPFL